MNIQPGIYLEDINNGKLKKGDILVYENKNVKISLTVMKDGRVKLKKGQAIVKNMSEVMGSEFEPLIELVQHEWRENDTIFIKPKDCIKRATGRKRLLNGQYPFILT